MAMYEPDDRRAGDEPARGDGRGLHRRENHGGSPLAREGSMRGLRARHLRRTDQHGQRVDRLTIVRARRRVVRRG